MPGRAGRIHELFAPKPPRRLCAGARPHLKVGIRPAQRGAACVLRGCCLCSGTRGAHQGHPKDKSRVLLLCWTCPPRLTCGCTPLQTSASITWWRDHHLSSGGLLFVSMG